MINPLPEPISVTLLVIDVLEHLQIDYVVVGSLASTQLKMGYLTVRRLTVVCPGM